MAPERYCRACKNAYARENRQRHWQLDDENRRKANCRSYSNVLVRRGVLVPEPCFACGRDAEKHHPDYDDPRTVLWMCKPCHRIWHELMFHMERRLSEIASR